MAGRMRELDWSATPLGPVEQWPQALRTCVRIILASAYPMNICCGPDYASLYNDEYAKLAGTRHPGPLGRRIFDVFPEVRHLIGQHRHRASIAATTQFSSLGIRKTPQMPPHLPPRPTPPPLRSSRTTSSVRHPIIRAEDSEFPLPARIGRRLTSIAYSEVARHGR
jgi:hypothetical protein